MREKILKHFKKEDKILFSLAKNLKEIKKVEPENPRNYFKKLCREIIGQQLSGKVSGVIFSRFENLFPRKRIVPAELLKIADKKLRSTGLSAAKANYVKNLAEKVSEKQLDFGKFAQLSDQEIKEELIKFKGIGPWTAEMFLMFTLGREDVFSCGDLAIRKSIKKLYGFKDDPTIDEMKKVSDKWSPYRTYACFALWKSLD